MNHTRETLKHLARLRGEQSWHGGRRVRQAALLSTCTSILLDTLIYLVLGSAVGALLILAASFTLHYANPLLP